jgi:hypothetical protein
MEVRPMMWLSSTTKKNKLERKMLAKLRMVLKMNNAEKKTHLGDCFDVCQWKNG